MRGDSHARFGRASRGDNRPEGRHCAPARLLLLGRRPIEKERGQRPFGAPFGALWENRRVKNDELDATELAKRLWRDDLPEAGVAPQR